jgi:hypothetical protein
VNIPAGYFQCHVSGTVGHWFRDERHQLRRVFAYHHAADDLGAWRQSSHEGTKRWQPDELAQHCREAHRRWAALPTRDLPNGPAVPDGSACRDLLSTLHHTLGVAHAD